MGLDNWSGSGSGTASGNRWQGYSHQQLYNMLHSGPGPAAAGTAADRWSTMAGALSDIQQDIMASLDDMFRDMFTRMNVGETGELVARHTQAKVVPVPLPPALARMLTLAA